MSLTDQIAADLIAAMKAKETIRLEALRAVKTAFILARSEKGAGSQLSPGEELKVMQKLVKQRRESAAIYREQKRPDLFEKEEAEADVIEKYLPARMSDDELTAAVKNLIEKTGATGPSDMGKVMGAASKELAGKADGKDIAAKVKQILGL